MSPQDINLILVGVILMACLIYTSWALRSKKGDDDK